MTRGRRGEKTYTGYNGSPTDLLRGRDKLRVQGSGIDGRHAPPSSAALRAYIDAQRCPWCDRGPFKSLAVHTNKVHGVPAAELRELADLTRYAPLCAPETSAKYADLHVGQRLPDSAYAPQRKRRTFSAAGRRSQRAKAALVSQADRERAARSSGDKQLRANAAKHAEIIRLYKSGAPIAEIAASVGMSKKTVVATAKRAGIYVDGRTRRHAPCQ